MRCRQTCLGNVMCMCSAAWGAGLADFQRSRSTGGPASPRQITDMWGMEQQSGLLVLRTRWHSLIITAHLHGPAEVLLPYLLQDTVMRLVTLKATLCRCFCHPMQHDMHSLWCVLPAATTTPSTSGACTVR